MSADPREKNVVRLEKALQEYRKLCDTRIRIEAHIERYSNELNGLCEEAQREFGTSDPDKLAKLAEEMEKKDSDSLDIFESDIKKAITALQLLEAV